MNPTNQNPTDKSNFSRRNFLSASAGAVLGLGAAPVAAVAEAATPTSPKRTRRVGAAAISFRYTMKSWKEDSGLQFLEASHRAGAEVAMLYPQMVDKLDGDQLRKLRARAEELNVMLEVHGSDPFRASYETTLRQSAALGVKAVGCYCGMLVRPDKAPTLEAWDAYMARAEARLRELEPLARQLGITIAIENHLDFTIEELYNLVKKFDSPSIGVLFDIGNGVATLDDPVAAAELLGPYVACTHYKDFAVELITRGFLFTMVPLGCGSLKLDEITRALEKRVRPGAGYSIEMMCGQQFEVKWLEDRFWVPYRNKQARDVAATLRHIRSRAIDINEMKPEKELDLLPHDAYVQLEFDRVQHCIAFLKNLLDKPQAA